MQTLETAFFLCVLTEKEHPSGPLCHAGCSLIPFYWMLKESAISLHTIHSKNLPQAVGSLPGIGWGSKTGKTEPALAAGAEAAARSSDDVHLLQKPVEEVP